MITTRESINYQFSIIFGYSSPNDIIVGDVIGPSKLTKDRINHLSEEVISYVRMFNAVLRDFTGSELYNIEFELDDFNQKDTSLKIYPKSMILTPGSFKECESLLLALKPETGIVNLHKSKESVDEISKLFFSVEEFSNHPDLSKEESKVLLQDFASRFSMKLFGQLLEHKWDKKLIGVKVSMPTEREMLDAFGSITSDVSYEWNKTPVEVNFKNFKYRKLESSLDESASIDHLGYSISATSANYVVSKTLELGSNLIDLANAGTVDDSKEKVVLFTLNQIENEFRLIKDNKSSEWIISETYKLLEDFGKKCSSFLKESEKFIHSGQVGSLEDILSNYRAFIFKNVETNDFFIKLCGIMINSIRNFIQKESQQVRASDLDSSFQYFTEIINSSSSLIQKSLPIFLSKLMLKKLFFKFISNLEDTFNKEQRPAMVIGKRILKDFKLFIENQIEVNPLIIENISKYGNLKLINEFKHVIRNNLSNYFESIRLNIGDLAAFAEIQMESDSTSIKEHIDKFKKFPTEIHFLLTYILRYSTINRFLKEHPENEISDPVTFSSKFYRFLEKRTGGIELNWRDYILDWINDYAKKFFKAEENRSWKLDEIFYDFLNYLEKRENREQGIDSFLNFLDTYISKNSNDSNKSAILEFYRKFEYSKGISTEFPKYIQDKIETEINLMPNSPEELNPIEIFEPLVGDSFLNYLREKKLKYFSNLIPRPISLTLIHRFDENEREQFKGDLFHVFNFKYWGKKCSFEILDNFKEVYRKWLREK